MHIKLSVSSIKDNTWEYYPATGSGGWGQLSVGFTIG